MNVETPTDLFVVELARIYTVEQRLVTELETLEGDVGVDALDDHGHADLRESLTSAIADHREETEIQVDRLEEALAAVNRGTDSRSTPALDGLLSEKSLFDNVVLNDGLRPFYYVGTAREIERLEISAYERLCQLADHLDVPEEVRETLETNLEEEVAALERLEELAGTEGIDELLDELVASQTPS